jgi:hypothetical protein
MSTATMMMIHGQISKIGWSPRLKLETQWPKIRLLALMIVVMVKKPQ